MELKQFITETLIQIAEGVSDAKARYEELGGKIASSKLVTTNFDTMDQGKQPILNIVEFEVVLAQSSSASNNNNNGIGVKLSVISGGIGKGKESKDESVTKVKFSVPVNLP